MMFFNAQRHDFFKPLSSKYREQIVQCLISLYQRQYSANADYGHTLFRDQVIEIFEEALACTSHQVFESDYEPEQRFKNAREQASWVLKQLLDSFWLERQVDTATLVSTYPFTRIGRIFTQSLIESDATQVRTRHRNTRNTLNALAAFEARGEIYDLLDAYEYSERIISDFTDVIAELDEKKRELVKEVESQQLAHLATDQFFEFMEKRFQPDIAVRLSADSVEKYREEICAQIKKIRHKKNTEKQYIERNLRRIMPDLCDDMQSYLWFILDTIELRLRNASEVMLPALRRALHGFTKRADIIIRQLSYLNNQNNNDLLNACQKLSSMKEQDYAHCMQALADQMSDFKLHLVDPASIKLLERKSRQALDLSIDSSTEVDQEALKELMIQQLLDQAFTVDNQHIKDYLIKALRQGRRIHSSHLPIIEAKDLLAHAHIIEAATMSDTSSDLRFNVKFLKQRKDGSDYYDSYDEFKIELVEKN